MRLKRHRIRLVRLQDLAIRQIRKHCPLSRRFSNYLWASSRLPLTKFRLLRSEFEYSSSTLQTIGKCSLPTY